VIGMDRRRRRHVRDSESSVEHLVGMLPPWNRRKRFPA
jgi:hypothetical protein